MSPPVWRCAKCDRTQGEDIEAPCSCGASVWVSGGRYDERGVAVFSDPPPGAPLRPGEFIDEVADMPRPEGIEAAVAVRSEFDKWTAPAPRTAYTIGADPAVNECKTCNGAGYLEGMAEVLRDERGVVEVWDHEECQDCYGTGVEPEPPTALEVCPKPNTP